MKKLPGLQDVNTDQQNGGLDEVSDLRPRDRRPAWASLRSLSTQRFYSAFGQSEVSIIYTQLNQYYVVLEVAPQYWQSPGGLELHLFASRQGNGVNVPLATVATS